MPVIWGVWEAECFFGRDWTGGIALKMHGKFRCARSVPSPYIEHCKQLSLADRQHGHISRLELQIVKLIILQPLNAR
jgi:hypothetical protein